MFSRGTTFSHIIVSGAVISLFYCTFFIPKLYRISNMPAIHAIISRLLETLAFPASAIPSPVSSFSIAPGSFASVPRLVREGDRVAGCVVLAIELGSKCTSYRGWLLIKDSRTGRERERAPSFPRPIMTGQFSWESGEMGDEVIVVYHLRLTASLVPWGIPSKNRAQIPVHPNRRNLGNQMFLYLPLGITVACLVHPLKTTQPLFQETLPIPISESFSQWPNLTEKRARALGGGHCFRGQLKVCKTALAEYPGERKRLSLLEESEIWPFFCWWEKKRMETYLVQCSMGDWIRNIQKNVFIPFRNWMEVEAEHIFRFSPYFWVKMREKRILEDRESSKR